MRPFEGLPEQDAAALRAMGPVWADDINRHREQVVAVYTPLLAATDRRGVTVDAGLAYGSHARQRLDIHRSAATPARGAPVAVFVHGGAFMRGNMNSNAEIYGNVARYIARHGYVAVNLEYRLAPEAPFPGGADDVAQALAWLRTHVGAYAGNPEHIVLIGHSAGGAHAASYVLGIGEAGARAGTRHGLSGLVLVSARLRADARPDNPNAAGVRAYWGDDESLYEQRSPVTHAAHLDLPTLVAIAEYENPHLDAYGAEFFHRALQAGARGLRFLQVPGHNHTSIVAHLDTADQSFGPALIGFLDSTRPQSKQET
ncbi:alpha/beta hydrolase [Pseudoduganella aquatica]|uniref:alpha/beta hydrolase n=1 Tax=Pseudoduganella aquatica TaxID=2660641 RepID=UPI001E3C850A|nr:alpha/beta hydrolase [Pseudoduganella aquatica]